MAVIINELEVVVGSEEPPAIEQHERPAAEPPLRPEDINDVVERQLHQLMRVLAH